MSKPTKATIETVEQALAFLDYQSAFAKGDTAANCSEIARVIRDLIGGGDSEDDAEWVYVGSPADVVTALMQRAWDDDVGDDMRTLLETGATALKASLDRNVKLASVIEKSELGL
jgi:hypothetical protein